MSRKTAWCALITAGLLLAPIAPAAADPGHDVPDDAVITLRGDGLGHGRGMSQYGAYSAARDDIGHRKIVKTYYPKTRWATRGGRIEVLVSADDDRSLVVKNHRGLSVRAVGGRRWRPHRPEATRWRVKPDRRGRTVVSFHDGRWRTWKKLRADVQLSAGKRPLTLLTPAGRTRYRGALRSATDDHGDRVTVNVLSLEQYVRGVVPSEMPASWPQQALRAQAVASRSYAAWRRDHPLDVAYDLCDTTLCQVYGGASVEARATDRAVRRTAQRVLTHRRAPIFAEYSASNGGYTVDGGKPYLPAQPDPFEGTSPDYYGWTVTVTAAAMETEYGYDDLDFIRIVERTGEGPRGGRVLAVQVDAASGFSDTIRGDDFLADWGLPSTLFSIASVE